MLSAVLVGIAIWLGTEFGRAAVFPETGSAILFPPYAILAGALLLSQPRRWWVYIAASFVAHMLVDVAHSGRPTFFAVQTEFANATRALLVAIIWRRWSQQPPRFDTFRTTVFCLFLAGFVAPAVAAVVGAAVTVWNGQPAGLENAFARLWIAWFLSNSIVGITLLPFILGVAARIRSWHWPRGWKRQLEVAAVLAGLAVSGVVLLRGITGGLPISMSLYAPVPFILWVAIRFGPRPTSGALIVVTAATVAGIMNGWGAFAGRPSDTGLLSVYLFLTFTSVPCLLLAALLKEREVAVGALGAVQERYRLATTAGSVGVWDWRLDTNEIFVDPLLKSFLGYADHEIRNHFDDWRSRVHPDDQERVSSQAAASLASLGSFEADYRLVHKDGSIRWVLTRGVAVPDPSGAPRRVVGTTTHITERKLAELGRLDAELALRDRQREVAHLGRVTMLGQLSGALTHELRQPLTAILANAQAARRILTSPNPNLKDVEQILGDIIGDDARAGEVISRLNRLLKRGEPTFEPLELSDVVQDGLSVLHGDLVERGVTVKTELNRDLPRVSGDRIELQQVLINLVLNACDAMNANAPGERRLTIGTKSDDQGDVQAYVVDAGQGIPAQDLHHVFEPFVTTKPNGLGLGLAICKSIVSSHGGQLWATNNTERGATFHLALPSLGVRDGTLTTLQNDTRASV